MAQITARISQTRPARCHPFRRVACTGIAATLLFGCGDAAAPRTTVVFELDAPLCSSALPVEFRIDSALVGTDTFRVHLPPNHTTSAEFTTTPGTHTLGAQVINGYIWTDTTVTLAEGERFSMLLPFYCSVRR